MSFTFKRVFEYVSRAKPENNCFSSRLSTDAHVDDVDVDDFIRSEYSLYLDHKHNSIAQVPHPISEAVCYQALSLLRSQHLNITNPNNLTSIEDLLSSNAIRYRRVEPESNFNEFDFGVMVGIRTDLENNMFYDVLSKFSNKLFVFSFSESSDSAAFSTVSCRLYTKSKQEFDYDYFLEIYPPLPYTVDSIASFLRFIFKEYNSDLFYVILFSLLGSSLQLLFPSLTVYVTSNVITLGSQDLAFQISILGFFLAVASISSLFIQSLFVTKLETESDKRAQTSVWDRLLKIELNQLTDYSISDLMTRAAAISKVRTLLSSSNITSLVSLLTSFAYIFIMYSYIPTATLFLIPLVVLYVFIIVSKAYAGGQLLSKSLTSSAELSNLTLQLLACLPEIRILGTYLEWEKKFVDRLRISQKLSYLFRRRDNSIDIASKSFQSLAFCLSFAVILYFIMSGKDISDDYIYRVLGFTSALTLFSTNLASGTITIADSIVQVFAYWKRAEPLVFSTIEPGYNPSNIDIVYSGDIKFQSVAFSYRSDTPPVFTSLTFDINKSDHNLLPFNPGQGSSTLFKLALGLYPTTSGHILFDGHHIDNLNVTSLRRSISLAPQSPYVPMGPLGDVFSGPLTITDDLLVEFLDAFKLRSMVDSLRMGLDTPIPPGASCFSNAQRQLFSLANAVSRYPKLLFIDNCMTSIKSEAKTSILNYIKSKGITTIVVDHDESFGTFYSNTIKFL